MKITVQATKFLKPCYNNNNGSSSNPNPSTSLQLPLSVFDKVTFDYHQAIIYAFPFPSPSTASIEHGLAVTIAKYREFAGRLINNNSNPMIILNDEGVLFIEATADCELSGVLPTKPTPELLDLHASLYDAVALAQIQLTRFACGSLVIGFTANHLVADGHATSNFLVSWGRAARGLDLGPLPLHRSDTLFDMYRAHDINVFEHRGFEYLPKSLLDDRMECSLKANDEIIMYKAHFSKEFISKLRAIASVFIARPYSRFETILAHLWRAVTKARALDPNDSTRIRVSVNGRARMNPRIPDEYFGNLVLWAWPTTTVGELSGEPVSYTAELIHNAVRRVDGMYFESFIKFANSGVIGNEGLAPAQTLAKRTRSPDLEVDSWLTFPFHELDFGSGVAEYFMPTYYSTEGTVYLLPSCVEDGSIDAFVPVFKSNLDVFKRCCYSLD